MKGLLKSNGLLISLLLFALPVFAIEPMPQIKKQLHHRGLWKTYLHQRQIDLDRGIDAPAKHAPNLKKLRMRGLGKTTTATYLHALVILVDFSDDTARASVNTQSAFDSLLFSEGAFSPGSMNDWYLENSYGQIGISGDVTPWLRMPHPYSFYVDGQRGFGQYPNNAQKMAEDAVAAADSLVDFSQFDNDGDGYVDALFIVHAGAGYESTGDTTKIHSHSWSISSPQQRDGVTVYGYTTEPELQSGHMVTMGVFGHEFGHALGLPDLYDTDYSSDGVGSWSMMGGGSWGGGGARPVHFDCWSKSQLGWLSPVNVMNDTTGVVLPPVERHPDAYRLWTAGATGPEYFMVENRQQTGFDQSVPGPGLLIWHVDESQSGNTNDWHPLLMLEQADGQSDLQHGYGSDGGDPFPGTTNNTEFNDVTTPNSNRYDGEYSFVAVSNIATDGDSMDFDASVSYSVPYILFDGINVRDFSGNRDRGLTGGETDTLAITLNNKGRRLENARVYITSGSPFIDILRDSVRLDSIGGMSYMRLDTSFIVAVDTNSTEWSVAAFRLQIDGANNYHYQKDFSLIINQGYGFQNDVESRRALWSHYNASESFSDEWGVSSHRNHTAGGTYAWKVGDPAGGNYSNSDDAALETPLLKLKDSTDYSLSFWHYMDAEKSDDHRGYAWDGGRIEMSEDRGTIWTILTPDGGYPYMIENNPESPFNAGSPVFSGQMIGWEKVDVPLVTDSSRILIRFRFGSDGYVTHEGWYIDDVEIVPQIPVGSLAENSALPATPRLEQNYPNPFNPATVIPYVLPKQTTVKISVYNILGQHIKTLVNTAQPAGSYQIRWDGTGETGHLVGTGIYFVRMTAGTQTAVRKITLLR